jgi:hypothetical protein
MKKIFFILFFINCLSINGQVVYTDINPDYVLSGGFPTSFSSKLLDINNDGIDDFEITQSINYNFAYARVEILPKNGNRIVLSSNNFVDTLNSNSLISSSSLYSSNNSYLQDINIVTNIGSGNWKNNPSGKFIGIEFNTSSGLNYGWIRMKKVNIIDSYGYNSISNQPILAGEGVINVAENVLLSDNGNNGDGRDLRIKFNKALFENKLNDYRVLVIPTAKVANFTIDSAKLVPLVNSFSIAPLNKNIDTTLNQLSTDVYGNLIKSLVSYKAIVLSYPNLTTSSDTLMSFVSNSITLTYPNSAISQPTVLSTFTSANNYNINVNFTPPASETGILHYRLYFLEYTDSVRFNLDTANNVAIGNYQVVIPTGLVQSLNYSSSSILTRKGQPLSALKKYKVKLMAYTDSVNTNLSSISPASNSFTVYTQVESVKNIVVEDIADSHSISDIKISFNKAVNESNISEYRAIVVPKANSNSFNLDSANSTLNYASVIPNGLNQTLVLSSGLMDFKGNSIIESSTYYLYVLSVNNGVTSDVNALSLFPKYFGFNTTDYFTAGQSQGANVIYHDIKDTTVAAVWHGADANYYMDIDSNGVNDILFNCQASVSGTGSSWLRVFVYPLNNTQVNFTSSTSNLVQSHDSLDMIYSDMNWQSNSGYLRFANNYTVPGYQNSSGGLFNLNKKHLAVRLIDQDTTYAWIKVSVPSAYIMNIYSYGLMKNDHTVGINDRESNNLVVWPVPASESIYVNETVKNISVYNNLGELVLKKFNTNFIEVSQLMSGIYIITVQTEKGTFQKKVVISR